MKKALLHISKFIDLYHVIHHQGKLLVSNLPEVLLLQIIHSFKIQHQSYNCEIILESDNAKYFQNLDSHLFSKRRINYQKYDKVILSDKGLFVEGLNSSFHSIDEKGCIRKINTVKNSTSLDGVTSNNIFKQFAENSNLETHKIKEGCELGMFLFPHLALTNISAMFEICQVNEFGFRFPIQQLESVKCKNKDDILIAVFGGSAAFSIYTNDGQSFPEIIHRKLNEHFLSNGIDKKVYVLNFSIPDSVVFAEFITYLTFVHALKPNIVIAHDGFNDFHYGSRSDESIMNHANLIYQNCFEKWSELLANSHVTSTSYDSPKKNTIPLVLKSYIERKQQWENICKINKTKFIWGLQPAIFFKTELHPWEYTSIFKNNPQNLRNNNCTIESKSYRMMRKLKGLKIKNFIDFNKKLDFSNKEIDFFDNMHLTPHCDDKVAQVYTEYIINNLK